MAINTIDHLPVQSRQDSIEAHCGPGNYLISGTDLRGGIANASLWYFSLKEAAQKGINSSFDHAD